ncbi:MAG: hypothetical protein KAJ19_19970 [Gammaproteobacteria bacterium]|nr:hypothetical protein [Gammaproteobacteria bacterium]
MTARWRCFQAFDNGLRPAEVAKGVGVSLKTACTYFYQWKRLPKHLGVNYGIMKRALAELPGLREDIIRILSKKLKVPKRKIKAQLASPWGIRQLVDGKWRALINLKEEEEKQLRLKAAARIIRLYEECGLSLVDIYSELYKLLQRTPKKRKN